MIHNLKTWPRYYQRMIAKEKGFEVRKNDRDFQTGDQLILQEFDPVENKYTGDDRMFDVTYILHGGSFGIDPEFVVMSVTLTPQ